MNNSQYNVVQRKKKKQTFESTPTKTGRNIEEESK